MELSQLTDRLTVACSEQSPDALITIARDLGYTEPTKTATNLRLLAEITNDHSLVARLAAQALDCADPDLGLNNLERLLGTLKPTLYKPVLTDVTRSRQLLTILSASQFLTGILCRKTDYFCELFIDQAIDQAKNEEKMQAELTACISETETFEGLQEKLRCYKAQEMLRIGSRDLCNLAELIEVTDELTSLAGATLQRSYEICSNLLRAEFGTPMVTHDDEELQEASFTILGMGKLGGRELNFSSDVDLMYFYLSEKGETTGIESARGETINKIPAHSYFVKLADMISKAIGQATEHGFVFRVDLDLRPEGRSGEIAQPFNNAILYYESWGQSWERSALIKARPVAGNLELGWRLLDELEPFIFRRNLDFAMLEDIKGMKQKIDSSLGRIREGDINLKLGRGGIREIEFFISALQLIHAGKKSSLRLRSSLAALDQLAEEELIEKEIAIALKEAYTFLRNVEHRIQVFQEKQTHSLPTRPEEMLTLARRSGFKETSSFTAELERHRAIVANIYRELFYTGDNDLKSEVRPEVEQLFDPETEPDEIKDQLEEWGFKSPDTAYDSLQMLKGNTPNRQLTRQARHHMERIAPLLMQEVIDSPEPEMTLANVERFLSALRARGTYFALLAENHKTMKLLVTLFGTSQFLTRIFIQHPEILDALVSGAYATPFKDLAEMKTDLDALMSEASDYEQKLEILRKFRNEEFLRIALNDLFGNTPQGEKTYQLSCLADCCQIAAVTIAQDELTPRYGRPFCKNKHQKSEPAEFVIVGMGKLGGMELNYHSDLDIIFVYQGDGETVAVEGTDPQRFKSQSNPQYFSRLAQRIISILSLVTKDGYVYQIDTRLRPSGNQGPLVTSLAAFNQYHDSSAQLWERQALIKARVIQSDSKLSEKLRKAIEHHAYDAPLPDNIKEEIARIRNRMEKEIGREQNDRFNIKTGRGGMVDVEFIAQYLQLVHGATNADLHVTNTVKALQKLNLAGILTDDETTTLKAGYKFLRRLENMLRLVHDQSIHELPNDATYLSILARRIGYQDDSQPGQALLEAYRTKTEGIRDIFTRYLPLAIGADTANE
jgi:glutamate-ammonia-ligase adenylyltransferase